MPLLIGRQEHRPARRPQLLHLVQQRRVQVVLAFEPVLHEALRAAPVPDALQQRRQQLRQVSAPQAGLQKRTEEELADSLRVPPHQRRAEHLRRRHQHPVHVQQQRPPAHLLLGHRLAVDGRAALAEFQVGPEGVAAPHDDALLHQRVDGLGDILRRRVAAAAQQSGDHALLALDVGGEFEVPQQRHRLLVGLGAGAAGEAVQVDALAVHHLRAHAQPQRSVRRLGRQLVHAQGRIARQQLAHARLHVAPQLLQRLVAGGAAALGELLVLRPLKDGHQVLQRRAVQAPGAQPQQQLGEAAARVVQLVHPGLGGAAQGGPVGGGDGAQLQPSEVAQPGGQLDAGDVEGTLALRQRPQVRLLLHGVAHIADLQHPLAGVAARRAEGAAGPGERATEAPPAVAAGEVPVQRGPAALHAAVGELPSRELKGGVGAASELHHGADHRLLAAEGLVQRRLGGGVPDDLGVHHRLRQPAESRQRPVLDVVSQVQPVGGALVVQHHVQVVGAVRQAPAVHMLLHAAQLVGPQRLVQGAREVVGDRPRLPRRVQGAARPGHAQQQQRPHPAEQPGAAGTGADGRTGGCGAAGVRTAGIRHVSSIKPPCQKQV